MKDMDGALNYEYDLEKEATENYLRELKAREEADKIAKKKRKEDAEDALEAQQAAKLAGLNNQLKGVQNADAAKKRMMAAAGSQDERKRAHEEKEDVDRDNRMREKRVNSAKRALAQGKRLKPWQREILQAQQAPAKSAEEILLEEIKKLQAETKTLLKDSLTF
jgi:hypothetical protein